jgi:8-amino-3,8-dideoxy-alpha-D-manno-octulosonate transaminase
MERPLFEKIIHDLAEMRYQGTVIFAPWSEPLLDPRLPSLVEYAHRHLPRSAVTILTNGDLLTLELFRELRRAGVGHFDISDHFKIVGGRYVIDEPAGAARTYQSVDQKEQGTLHFHDSNSKRIRGLDRFHNRAGAVPLDHCVSVQQACATCLLPEAYLTIGYDGRVVLCARQWEATPVYGNAGLERIRDIWRNPAFRNTRRDLRRGVFELDLCRRCELGDLLDPAEVSRLRAERELRSRSEHARQDRQPSSESLMAAPGEAMAWDGSVSTEHPTS